MIVKEKLSKRAVVKEDGHGVKNGFSNPTKAQGGRDWPRKDVMNRRRKKALREGCREIKEARVLSLQERR